MKNRHVLARRFEVRVAAFAIVLMAMMGFAQGQSQGEVAGAAHPNLLVSTDWLSRHRTDPNLVIIHIAHKDIDYGKAHIPGARFLATGKIADLDDHPGTELLPDAELKKNLEAMGIGDDSNIVIYSTDYDPIAARLFYTLDYLGHGDQASLLDGGITKWQKESRPLTAAAPDWAAAMLTIHPQPGVNAKMDWIKSAISIPGRVALVDARPMRRYKDGHLPGAMPLYWEDMQKDGVLKSPEELRQMFAAAGYAPGKKVVSYCEVGQQASYDYFVARYLGLPDPAMYDGSYMEWSVAKQPVVKGSKPL